MKQRLKKSKVRHIHEKFDPGFWVYFVEERNRGRRRSEETGMKGLKELPTMRTAGKHKEYCLLSHTNR